VLKVSGQNSYLHGNYELTQFAYIVRSLTKKRDIELTLVRKLDPAMDRPRDIEDVRLGLDGEFDYSTSCQLMYLTRVLASCTRMLVFFCSGT